ncbi:MAG: uncharacterized protein A8A55_2165 [Amphiamblys sp. WSBS2006]|nr:MAG: uncharacterized protein A8A55_2165 [Amphiamblys sp. WSBS2006]
MYIDDLREHASGVFEDREKKITDLLRARNIFYDRERSLFSCADCKGLILGSPRMHLKNHHKVLDCLTRDTDEEVRVLFPGTRNLSLLTTDLPMFEKRRGWGCSKCFLVHPDEARVRCHCRQGTCKSSNAHSNKKGTAQRCTLSVVNYGKSQRTGYKFFRFSDIGIFQVSQAMQDAGGEEYTPALLTHHELYREAIKTQLGTLDAMYVSLGWYTFPGNVDILEQEYGYGNIRGWLNSRESRPEGVDYEAVGTAIEENIALVMSSVDTRYTDEGRRKVMHNGVLQANSLGCLGDSARLKYSRIAAGFLVFVCKYRAHLRNMLPARTAKDGFPEVFTARLEKLLTLIEEGKEVIEDETDATNTGKNVYTEAIVELLRERVDVGRWGVSNKLSMYIRATARTRADSLESPDFITQRCSAIEYVARLSVLEGNRERTRNTEADYSLLAPHEESAFGSVLTIHMEGTKAKVRRGRKRFVEITNENGELCLVWGSGHCTLSHLRSGIEKLLGDVEEKQNSLLGGRDVSRFLREDKIDEKLGCTLSTRRLSSVNGDAEVFLLKEYESLIVPGGVWTARSDKHLQTYVAEHTAFMKLLFPAVHLLSGPPNRGTEKMQYTLVNSPNWLRSVYFTGGELMLHTPYCKAKNKKTTGLHFPGTRLSRVLLIELLIVRPFLCEMMKLSEVSLVEGVRIVPVGMSRAFYAEHLFVCDWNRMSEEVICDSVKGMTARYLGRDLKISDYRQLAAAIIDRLSIYGGADGDREEYHQLGHRPSTNTGSYGGTTRDPPATKNWQMSVYKRSSRIFQELFGIEPPKEILRHSFYAGLDVFKNALPEAPSPNMVLGSSVLTGAALVASIKAGVCLLSPAEQEEMATFLRLNFGTRTDEEPPNKPDTDSEESDGKGEMSGVVLEEGSVSAVDESGIQEEEIVSEATQKENLEKEKTKEEDLRKEAVRKEKLQKEAARKEKLQKEKLRREAALKEKLRKEAALKEAELKEKLQREAALREATPKEHLQRSEIVYEKRDCLREDGG